MNVDLEEFTQTQNYEFLQYLCVATKGWLKIPQSLTWFFHTQCSITLLKIHILHLYLLPH